MKSKHALAKKPINKQTPDAILMGFQGEMIWVPPDILLLMRKTEDHYRKLCEKDVELILKAYLGKQTNESPS